MSEKAIAIRSKESIVKSLFALLKKDNYHEITISEIAAGAQIDRRTFYRHFKTKEDVIAYYMKATAHEYEVLLMEHQTFDNLAIAESFFGACSKNSEELLLLINQNLSHLLLAEMEKVFMRYQAKFASAEELNHPNREYMLAYHIGGFWNLMVKWLLGGKKQSVREMAEIVGRGIHIDQI